MVAETSINTSHEGLLCCNYWIPEPAYVVVLGRILSLGWLSIKLNASWLRQNRSCRWNLGSNHGLSIIACAMWLCLQLTCKNAQHPTPPSTFKGRVPNLLLGTPPSTPKNILLEKNSLMFISSRTIMQLNPNNFLKAACSSDASSISGVFKKKKNFPLFLTWNQSGLDPRGVEN